ncbi:hypothetical protein MNV49_007313 [Pseudohyphozyma bogoriensis]|nr:hypothetical protein MNV49_007313 [Pseudohyphozyma bogoriensis]
MTSLTLDEEQAQILGSSIKLPCGQVVPNRLVKAPLEELLGYLGGGDPTEDHLRLYEEWARGGWGLIMTGNVMVNSAHLGTPCDVVIPNPSSPTYADSLATFKTWAAACHRTSSARPLAVMQLNHPGRQSSRGSGRSLLKRSLAPSAVPLSSSHSLGRLTFRAFWGTPKAMSSKDIDELVASFVHGARVAKESGFDGVELHASHGYLLSQFMSPNVNLRTDDYGGTPRKRLQLVFRIIAAVRKEYPSSSGFCLGIKLNSSDYVEKDALDNVRWLAEHGGVDFIEVSGGNYENPHFMKQDSNSFPASSPTSTSVHPSSREAFFLTFASTARAMLHSLPPSSLPTPPPLILITGGLRTRNAMAETVSSSSADLVGLGRPACADPRLPLKLLDGQLGSEEARAPKYTIKGAEVMKLVKFELFLPGVSTLFHTMLLTQISRGEKPDVAMNFLEGVWRVWFWPLLCEYWLGVSVAVCASVVVVSTWL